MSFLIEVATHALAVVGGIAVHSLLGPVATRQFEAIKSRRALQRRRQARLPDPPQKFAMYTLGNLQLPVMNLFGTPRLPLLHNQIKIDFSPTAALDPDDLPISLRDAIPQLLSDYLSKHQGDRLRDNPIPRYLGYTQEGETSEDLRGKITLHLGLTTFFRVFATNFSLDQEVIPADSALYCMTRNQSLRQAYLMKADHRPEDSYFANPLSSHCIVISRNRGQSPNDQVLIQLRKKGSALYPEYYQSSAAGFVNLAHRDRSGSPSPFVTAVSEVNQEIADRLEIPYEEFRLIGIAVTWAEYDHNAYGFVETGLSSAELIGDTRRDAYEGWIESIPFTPQAVLQHIGSHQWEATGAMAMCQALLAFYPRRDVEAEAQKMPAKSWRQFCDLPENRLLHDYA